MGQFRGIVDAVPEFIESVTSLATDSPFPYLLIFGLTVLDVVFPLLPAEPVVTAAGVLAGSGGLHIGWVILAAALGAFAGDNLAYWIGRSAGRSLSARLAGRRAARLAAIEQRFRVHGATLIIAGRFVPGGRTVVAGGAGVVRLSWPRFAAFDAAAAIIWALQAAVPGYIGGVVAGDQLWFAFPLGFGLSVLVGGGLALIQRRRSRRRACDTKPEPTPRDATNPLQHREDPPLGQLDD